MCVYVRVCMHANACVSRDACPGMPGHVLSQKTDFDGLLLKNRNFSEQMTNTKVVDNGLYYLNMKFEQNR